MRDVCTHLSYYSCMVARLPGLLWGRSYTTISRSERSNQLKPIERSAVRSGPGGGVSIDEPRLTDGGLALALALALALGGWRWAVVVHSYFLFLAVGFSFLARSTCTLPCIPPSQWPPRRPSSCPSSRSPSSSSFPPYPLQVPTRSSFPTLLRKHFVLSLSSSAYSVRCLPSFCVFLTVPRRFCTIVLYRKKDNRLHPRWSVARPQQCLRRLLITPPPPISQLPQVDGSSSLPSLIAGSSFSAPRS